jgi:hypothetical protein
MTLCPITIRQAHAVVGMHHRHNAPTAGGRFALGAKLDGKLVAVAIVGRTTARLLHDDLTAEISRLCALPDAPPHACSFLYGACRRVWQAMGGRRIVTYTLQSESGASLRAAGFVKAATFHGAQWGRAKRPRSEMAVCGQSKFRWEAVSA